MPVLNFLNRDENQQQDTAAAAAKSSALNAALLHLPSEQSRRIVRDRVMTAAANVVTKQVINTSKCKETKKQDSIEVNAQEAYKDRLQEVLGCQNLFPIISTCLVIDPKEEKTSKNSTTISLHETFACSALLLCNFVLLTASGNNNDDNNKKAERDPSTIAGYDARIRNVLQMASIELLTEALEREDTDGTLLKTLKHKQQTHAKVKSIEDVVVGEGASDDMESHLNDLLEAGYTNEQQQAANDDEKNGNTTNENTIEEDPDIKPLYDNLYRKYATRKYQALENATAELIMHEMVESKQDQMNEKKNNGNGRFSRTSLVRAAKIGGVGLAAGGLMAFTGGLAAPGIAAGLAALGVGGTALTLASPAAIITLFGVGGGGLSAYKMKRRTDSLSEFTIHQETSQEDGQDGSESVHLHTTVLISGWLNDEHDFQRPWGVTPNDLSKSEKLQRFFSVVDPQKVGQVVDIMKTIDDANDENKQDEKWNNLSSSLKKQYGKSPHDLLPLKERQTILSEEENATLRELFDAIMKSDRTDKQEHVSQIKPNAISNISVLPNEDTSNDNSTTSQLRVWDFQSEYGGDLYTVKWESKMLLNMCHVVDNMIKDLANKATKEVLKQTALATLMAAIAWPSLLMGLAGSLDNDWTLITLRSDLAGIELAKSLLQSDERRPVNLIGYSFGARIVFSCLLELARHQVLWKEQQKGSSTSKDNGKKSNAQDAIEYKREPASIVQDAIMMGAPLFVSITRLSLARQMVASRFVNCYSGKDWILSLMFQYQNASGIMRQTCGTGPITGINGIENYDVSCFVSSWHANYCDAVPDILTMVGFDQPKPSSM